MHCNVLRNPKHQCASRKKNIYIQEIVKCFGMGGQWVNGFPVDWHTPGQGQLWLNGTT